MVTRKFTIKYKNKHKQQHGNPHDAQMQLPVLPARSWSIITTSNAATILHTGSMGHAMCCSIRQGNIYCLYIILHIISIITTSNAAPSCILGHARFYTHFIVRFGHSAIAVFFSCPGQLNRWHCQSLSQSVSQSDFWFQRLQTLVDTSRHW